MSRRKDAQWRSFLRTKVVGGGEEYDWDYMAIAEEAGLDWRDFVKDYRTGELDSAKIMTEARRALGITNFDETRIIAYVVVRCQRCDQRLDRITLIRSEWAVQKDAPPPTVVSTAGNRLDGTKPLTYKCGCGRRDVQVSRRRVGMLFRKALADDVAPSGGHYFSAADFVRARAEIRA